MGFLEKAKGFMLSPSETFRASRGDTLGDGLKYAVIWYAILGILIGIVAAVLLVFVLAMFAAIPFIGQYISGMAPYLFLLIPFAVVLIVVMGIVGLIIGGAWLHLWVYVCGGRKGYTQTVKAMAYGGTPAYVLGWIPFIGFIGAIWALVLEIIGVRELHEISTGRAVAAVLLTIIIPIAVYMGIFFYYIAGL
jgi:hypothetical protein